MLRSITFIKAVHTVIFFLLSGILIVSLYEVIFDKITVLTWIALALFLAEGIVLREFLPSTLRAPSFAVGACEDLTPI